MNETYNTKGIVLNRRDFRENDSLVTFYTQDKGKIDLVVRGTKKSLSKLVGHIEPINHSDVMVVLGRTYNYVGSVFNINVFSGIKNDFQNVEIAGKALSVFNKIVKPDHEDRGLYDGLLKFLDILDSQSIDKNLFYNFFLLKILTHLGYLPELYNCTKCGKKIDPTSNFFSSHAGGIICNGCGNNREYLYLSADGIKILRFVVSNELEKFTKLKISDDLKKEVILCISNFTRYNGVF